MAGIAGIAGINMQAALTRGCGAIMTTDTVTAEIGVVGYGTAGDIEPRSDNMAGITLSRGDDVIGPLAARLRAIVTTGTGAERLRVINRACRQRCPS